MKTVARLAAVFAVLLGGLWLLQGLGAVHVQPIRCLTECAPVQEPSAIWAIVGFITAMAGILAIRRSVKRSSQY